MKPTLSVFMITYNHEKYIAQAIDSILMQQVNFDYNIVIGEDCSSDGTRKILLDYQEKYPDKIKLILQKENVGMPQNLSDTLNNCTGKYVALLEGDDYWTDPLKLQKQVDFLEANPEFVLCFHPSWVKHDNSDVDFMTNPNMPKSEFDYKDIFKFNKFISTPSVVFRNIFAETGVPEFMYHAMSGDLAIQLYLANFGKFKFINEIMSVYRVHDGGITVAHIKNKFTLLRNRLKTLEAVDEQFKFKYNKFIKIQFLEIIKILLADDKCSKQEKEHFEKLLGKSILRVKIMLLQDKIRLRTRITSFFIGRSGKIRK